SGGSVTIPLGTTNSIDHGTIIGSIATTFPNTAEHILFGVKFYPSVTVTWTLNSKTATAGLSGVQSPPCQLAVGQSLPLGAKDRCWNILSNGTGIQYCDQAEDIDGDGF